MLAMNFEGGGEGERGKKGRKKGRKEGRKEEW